MLSLSIFQRESFLLSLSSLPSSTFNNNHSYNNNNNDNFYHPMLYKSESILVLWNVLSSLVVTTTTNANKLTFFNRQQLLLQEVATKRNFKNSVNEEKVVIGSSSLSSSTILFHHNNSQQEQNNGLEPSVAYRSRDSSSTTTAAASLLLFPFFVPTLSLPLPLMCSSLTTSASSRAPALANGTSTTTVNFIPDFTEHPKPSGGNAKRKHAERSKQPPVVPPPAPPTPPNDENDNDDDNENENEIAFFHDFIAGGVAGCASVIVGHPFDTIKVRMQTSKHVTDGLLKTFTEFGGVSSLFRGMTAPLYTAALVNAIIFASYGLSSRIYNDMLCSTPLIPTTYNSNCNDDDDNDNDNSNNNITQQVLSHDPWQKAMICGAFSGWMQCFIICPMEHVKCRLQTQLKSTTMNKSKYTSPLQATRSIVTEYGFQRLYQGWWTTCWREVPAFGLYFAIYDYLKDQANEYLAEHMDVVHTTTYTNNDSPGSSSSSSSSSSSFTSAEHSHTWLASAFAGGCAGCATWAFVYPIDVIKTHIQTSPLSTPLNELSMYHVGRTLIQKHGVRYLFRGLSITLIRAFPVNGTIFPVYEFTLKQVCQFTDTSSR